VLALLVRDRPNLLLLDEPTNHLDLEMRHALTAALTEFGGSMVLVSHDRALLRTVCDAFLLVADGRVVEFDGDLDDCLAWLVARRETGTSAGIPAARIERREARERVARERREMLNRRRLLFKEVERLDRELAQLHDESERIERQLADPAFYARPDAGDMKQLALRRQELVRRTEEAEHRWLELHAAMDQLGEA
jgi:ATP-binding cassette subfamily F protein 3